MTGGVKNQRAGEITTGVARINVARRCEHRQQGSTRRVRGGANSQTDTASALAAPPRPGDKGVTDRKEPRVAGVAS